MNELSDKKVEEFFREVAKLADLDLVFAILEKGGRGNYIAGFTKNDELKEIQVDLSIAPAVVLELGAHEFIDEKIPEYAKIVKRIYSEKSSDTVEYNSNAGTVQ